MKRQISQKRQVDAGCTGEVIVNGVRVLIGPVGELEQGQGEIGGNTHVEFGFTEGGDDDGTVAGAARDLLPADIQFRVQPVNRKRAIVRILNVEFDREILLQEISAAQLNADHRDIGPVEFWRHQGTRAQANSQGENLQRPWQHARNDTDFREARFSIDVCGALGEREPHAGRACQGPDGHMSHIRRRLLARENGRCG